MRHGHTKDLARIELTDAGRALLCEPFAEPLDELLREAKSRGCVLVHKTAHACGPGWTMLDERVGQQASHETVVGLLARVQAHPVVGECFTGKSVLP